GSDFARIAKLAPLVVPDQQCAKPDSTSGRVGEATDDKFLFVDALELEPVRGSRAWLVLAVPPLRNHALQSVRACLLVEGLALRVAMRFESHRASEGDRLPEQALAQNKAHARDVVTVDVDQVEDVVEDGDSGPTRGLRVL